VAGLVDIDQHAEQLRDKLQVVGDRRFTANGSARVADGHGQFDMVREAGALVHEVVQQVLALAYLERVEVNGARVEGVLHRHHLRRQVVLAVALHAVWRKPVALANRIMAEPMCKCDTLWRCSLLQTWQAPGPVLAMMSSLSDSAKGALDPHHRPKAQHRRIMFQKMALSQWIRM